MQKRVEVIKSSEEVGVKFMQEWEEKIIEKQRAREAGLAEGRAEAEALTSKRYSQLILKLSETNHMEDMLTAAKDSAFLEKLYLEFEL